MAEDPPAKEISGAARMVLDSVTAGVPPVNPVAPVDAKAARRAVKKKTSAELRDIYKTMPFVEDLVNAAVSGLYDDDPRVRSASMAALTRLSVDIFKKITARSDTKGAKGFSWGGLQAPSASGNDSSSPSPE